MSPPLRFVRPPSLLALIAVAVGLSAVAHAQAQPQQRKMFVAGSGPDELWETTMKMEMPGFQMPAQSSQNCVKRGRAQRPEDQIPKDDKCQTTDVKVVGNKVTFKMACTGSDPMTGTGEITSTPTSYEGRMHMVGTSKNRGIDMTQVFTGKKVGACTDQSEEVIAGLKADTDAARAKACADGLENLQAAYFFGKGASCANQQKQFCDKVGGIARDAREPAGYRAATRKHPSIYLGPAFTACGQDFAVTRKAACTSGVSSKDWSFVGSGACDGDVRVQGDVMCKGIALTGMNRAIVPLCNRYARVIRGGATEDGDAGDGGSATAGAVGTAGTAKSGSAGASGVAKVPEPKPANTVDTAVQEGVNVLKKLLPF
jgi:hypothetical protein